MMWRYVASYFLLLIIAATKDANALDVSKHHLKPSMDQDIQESYGYVVLSTMSAIDGERMCLKYGDGLAIVKTEEQRQHIADFIKSTQADYHTYWIGASDVGKTPGDFFWRDGTKVNHSSWAPDNPNDFKAGQMTCVNVQPGAQHFLDSDCSEKFSYRPLCHLGNSYDNN